MTYHEFQQIVVDRAQVEGLTEYELYYRASESTSIGTFQREINEFSSSTDGGVCFRCIVDGKMGYASTEALSAEEANALVRRAMENAQSLESEEPVFLCEGGKEYAQVKAPEYPLPETEEMVSTALAVVDKLYAANEKVIDGSSAEVYREKMTIAIRNSKGLDLTYAHSGAGIAAAAVVKENGEMSDAFEMKHGQLSTIDTDEMVAKAVSDAIDELGGEPAPTGAYPVVFAPQAMASLLAAFSSVFSSESALRGLTRMKDQEGQTVAAPLVTLVDDPFYPDSAMPMPFDAEGCPTHTKNIIEKGVLKTLLYNLKTAHQAGKETTGNAFKGGYAASVDIRPFTMYLAPGDLTEEQLLEKAGTGVYINSLGGLHAGANAVSGDFSLQSAGFLIEGGKKTSHVKSFTVAGNFYDLLKNITALSDTVKPPRGMGMTAFCAPAVLVEGLTVSGK